MSRSGSSYSVEFSHGPDAGCLSLDSGKHFRFGFQEIYHYFNALPGRMEDLLRVAMGVFVVDRLSKRRQRSNNGEWSRNLSISVGVNDPEFWRSSEVAETLHDVLDDLSGDFWDVTFSGTDTVARYQQSLFANLRSDEEPLVCLYSGGLDSAAGFAQQVHECHRQVIPVTVIGQSMQRKMVKQQLRTIGRRSKAMISPLMAKSAIIWHSDIEGIREESSQRSRSFLFMSVAAVTAALAKAGEVAVFESGIGSLNIPLMAGMVGSMATRSCHPRFLKAMGRLVSLVAQKDIRFVVPYADRTKGEMVRWLNDNELSEIVANTVSCASFPVRYGKQQPCGICSACIFRRQAIASGGILEDAQSYKYDLMSEQASAIPSEKLSFLKAFLIQASRLPEKEGDPLTPAVRTHLLNSGIGQSGGIPGPVLGLLRRYRKEWFGFARLGATKGAKWPSLLLGSATHTKGGRND